MWAVFFYCCAAIIIYTYLGYPALLYLFTIGRKTVKERAFVYQPAVSIIIAAYNEEKVISAKIENTLALNYPISKMQIIVAAHGSADQTASIASSFKDVLVLHSPERRGKAAAVNQAMGHSIHPVIVLTDANTFLTGNSLERLVIPFADAETGAVAGEKKVISTNGAAVSGEGLYWRYESWLKKQETKFYTVVGAAGELFAFRKELFVHVPEQTITDDFFISLSVNLQKKKTAYAEEAISSETASLSLNDEWKRKVRIAAGGIQSLFLVGEALNLFRYPLLAFQFFSHRVLRWVFCAPALFGLFISNALLVLQQPGGLFMELMIVQVFFYGVAFAGWLLARKRRSFFFFNIPFYIVFMHAAMLAGILRYANGAQSVLWEKAER